jgi:hypothetical protein
MLPGRGVSPHYISDFPLLGGGKGVVGFLFKKLSSGLSLPAILSHHPQQPIHYYHIPQALPIHAPVGVDIPFDPYFAQFKEESSLD